MSANAASLSASFCPANTATSATAQACKLKAEFGGELHVPGNHQLVPVLIEGDLALQFLALRCHHYQSFRPGEPVQ